MIDKQRIERIASKLPALTSGQADWLERVIDLFNGRHEFILHNVDLLSEKSVQDFGDALRIHHGFSLEPFSKDKFEYVFESVLKTNGIDACLADKGNPGHDISIDGTRTSLKTQADKNIKRDSIWISKFMELGRGEWSDRPEQLVQLREMFFQHMNGYERIFTLRAIEKSPNWEYELVEIPKPLLLSSIDGRLEMKLNSRQMPKPGYCYVEDEVGNTMFQLYFDGGGERKLQIKKIDKRHCILHAEWKFTVPPI